eukprot:scaffold10974_cov207-Skeletonema_dohrnii-CCMP3373.AAC.7
MCVAPGLAVPCVGSKPRTLRGSDDCFLPWPVTVKATERSRGGTSMGGQLWSDFEKQKVMIESLHHFLRGIKDMIMHTILLTSRGSFCEVAEAPLSHISFVWHLNSQDFKSLNS